MEDNKIAYCATATLLGLFLCLFSPVFIIISVVATILAGIEIFKNN